MQNYIKKILIYIIAGLVLCGGSFWAGGIGPGKRAEGMESRVDTLQDSFDRSLEVNGALKKTNEALEEINLGFESENNKLRSDIEDLRDINSRFNEVFSGISDTIGDTGQGIEKAIPGIEKVEKGIDFYLEKIEAP